MAAALNIMMKGISTEPYILSFLLLRDYSAALQRALRHCCVSILWDTVQIQLLLGISKIIKGKIQQSKCGRKKNVAEATQVSWKATHAHSGSVKRRTFFHVISFSHLQGWFDGITPELFYSKKATWLKFIHFVTNLLHSNTHPEFKAFLLKKREKKWQGYSLIKIKKTSVVLRKVDLYLKGLSLQPVF